MSARAARRRNPGTASTSISCRFPSSSGARRLTPVVLPPCLASELTKPDTTMSSVNARMGTVVVAFCAALVAGSPPTMITSTGDLNSSDANCETSSTRVPYVCQSTVRYAEFGVTNTRRVLEYGIEHRLKLAGRRTDYFKHFRGRRLLL